MLRKGIGIVIALAVIGAIIGGTHKKGNNGSSSGSSTTNVSASSSSSGSSGKSSAPQTVIFTVTGSAPAGADVTFGDDTSNYQGRVPMRVVLPLRKNVLYYSVTAQLQGGGSITCRVQIGKYVRIGHAVGNYNICTAQLNNDPFGGWN